MERLACIICDLQLKAMRKQRSIGIGLVGVETKGHKWIWPRQHVFAVESAGKLFQTFAQLLANCQLQGTPRLL